MSAAPHTPSGLAEPLRSRWSPSLFDPTHRLEAAAITQLLQAAQWAPSWGNSQPWHWLVCGRDTPGFEQLLTTLSTGNQAWVPRVSAVFVSVVQVAPVGEQQPSPYAAFDVGQASAHITLQAQAMGLATHQFAGFDRQQFGRLMGVPASYEVVAGLAIGRLGDPDQIENVAAGILAKDQRVRVRRPLAEQAFETTWGQPWSGLQTTPDKNGTAQ